METPTLNRDAAPKSGEPEARPAQTQTILRELDALRQRLVHIDTRLSAVRLKDMAAGILVASSRIL